MLLSLSIITAVLIGSWIFTVIIETKVRNAKVSTQPSAAANSQFSLWSLVCFLFFPTESVTPSPLPFLPPRELN